MPEGDLPAYPLSGTPSGAVAHRIRCALSDTIRVDVFDPHRLTTGEGGHHGAKGPGSAAGATDDPTEVIGMNTNLQDLAATQVLAPDRHILIVVESIGNLTLLEKPVNRALGNKDFHIKRDKAYSLSKLAVNADVAGKSKWTWKEIEERSKALSAIAKRVWSLSF